MTTAVKPASRKLLTRRLLVVEDNLGDVRLLREMFSEDTSHATEVTHVESIGEAEEHLAQRPVDIILLDLGLPDTNGLDAVRRAHTAAPGVPLVVLTGLDDESMAAQALQEGAQDYLIKGQIETRGLLRAMRHAIERKVLDDGRKAAGEPAPPGAEARVDRAPGRRHRPRLQQHAVRDPAATRRCSPRTWLPNGRGSFDPDDALPERQGDQRGGRPRGRR